MRTRVDNPSVNELYAETERHIAVTPLLSVEAEQACARKCTAEARLRLIESHMPLVKSIAFGFKGCGVDVKDLFQQGMLGLCKAVDKYQPGRGRLGAFARHFISGEILCCLNKEQTLFHLPSPLRRSVNKFHRVCRQLGQGATDEAIATAMGCDVAHVPCFRECAEHRFESLDAPVGDEDDAETLGETIGELDPRIAEVDAKLTVQQLLSKLSPTERDVIRLRYGFEGAPLSLRKVGARFNRSHQWVAKVERAAIAKLRKHAQR